jgi:hypothetical protein
MLKTKLTRALLSVLLAAGCGAANAGVLTFQGVTFTSSATGDMLTLEIDAANPSGDWATATTIGALELKNIGTFTAVQLMSAPGAASGWTLWNNELTANGCDGAEQPGSFACFSGAHVALTDDMVFRFQFSGDALALGEPSLKVNFFAGDDTEKVGSLLSMTIPAGDVPPPSGGGDTPPGGGGDTPPGGGGDTPPPTEVPEPQTAAILLTGLGLMGLLKRRKNSK